MDYVSLFDSKADINDLKKCRSDPAIMKQAVKKLKDFGFSVTSTGRCSLFFFGPPGLFEEAFAVRVIAEAAPFGEVRFTAHPTSGEGTPSASFPIPEGEFSGFIAGVRLIRPPATALSPHPPPKIDPRNDLYLEELYGKLGGESRAFPPTSRKVCVVDTDCLSAHPWFAGKTLSVWGGNFHENLEQEKRFLEALDAVRGFLESASKELKTLIAIHEDGATHPDQRKSVEEDILTALRRLPGRAWRRVKNSADYGQMPDPRDLKAENGISFLTDSLECIRRMTDMEDFARQALRDQRRKNHGTAVTSNLLAIVPDADVFFQACDRISSASNRLFLSVSFSETVQKCLEMKPAVLNISWGTRQGPDESENQSARNSWHNLLDCAARNDCVVVLASANIPIELLKGSDLKLRDAACTETNTNHPCALVVGAAFRPDGAEEAHASDVACAHPAGPGYEAIPHVCGLSGGIGPFERKGKGNIFCPGADPDWSRTWGCSIAAPQVAGVCALVRRVYANASPPDIKTIIVETSTPITHGAAWNPVANAGGYSLWNESSGHKVGLVHIERAISLARFLADLGPYIPANLNIGRNASFAAFVLELIKSGLAGIDRIAQQLDSLVGDWDENTDFLLLNNGRLRINRLAATTHVRHHLHMMTATRHVV